MGQDNLIDTLIQACFCELRCMWQKHKIFRMKRKIFEFTQPINKMAAKGILQINGAPFY